MRRALLTLVATLIPVTAAGAVPLVELKTGSCTFRGKVVAKDDSNALLLDRDGAMSRVLLARVTSFSVAEKNFRSYSTVDLRDVLRRKVGAGEEIVAAPHFVACGRPEAARAVAQALEDVYDGYRWFCSTRNLPAGHPEFPLVALVLPNRASFDEFCRKDDVPPTGSLRGYYRETTNRFVCYETGGSIRNADLGGLRGTLVHEAIHQLAFNTGLHARMGENPLWVVEGFAMVLEPESARRPIRSDGNVLHRANMERLKHYLGQEDIERVKPSSLIASDDPFQERPLDSYATAWATTFYLLETKPTAYSRYLKSVAARDPLAPYPAGERLADFKATFGTDLNQFEAEVTRFLKRIASGERR